MCAPDKTGTSEPPVRKAASKELVYDKVTMQKNKREPLSWQMIEQMFPWIPAGPVLDVGAGAGQLAARFADHGFAVTALDKHAPVQEHAPLKWWSQDLRTTTLKPASWAAIVALNSFPFLPQADQHPQLERLCTALQPGGILIFSTFTPQDPGAQQTLAQDLHGTPAPTGTLSLQTLQTLFKDWEWLWHFEGEVPDDHPPAGPHQHHLVQVILKKPQRPASQGLSQALNSRLSQTHLGVSLGWRSPLIKLFENLQQLSFIEIMGDDYLDPMWDSTLLALSQRYQILLHGVELSVGTPGPIDTQYLAEIRRLADRTHCPWWRDHLCYTRTHRHRTFSLNPLPTTEEALQVVVERAKAAQAYVGKPLLLENAAYYWQNHLPAQMPDALFLKQIVEQADCGILLDVANLYGNAHNLGMDPYAYIDALPHDRVLQIHLAGGQHRGPLHLDTHDSSVHQETWKLFNYALKRCDVRAVILERDANFEDLTDVIEDLQTAQAQWGLRL